MPSDLCDEIKNILSRSIMIKHGTLNNKASIYYFGLRLPQNGSIIVQNWSPYVCLSPFPSKLFLFFWQVVQQQTVKTCKIDYN